ncbi:lipopolysaccharide biosynthesis protein [Mucilaginibacter sp.]|uniref:lipopolysaccharide biosynthesis protein n=1 Tax=Mucilaginibacter sp. TaxID=1882438 RepID=UPI0025D68139|nr:lipopolysaccharide biosynthesis protein [Mucilaginibacter sp.]
MAQVKENSNIPAEEVTLKDVILKLIGWWRFLLSKWATILFAAVIGAAVGLTYSFISKTKYVAELSFALDDDKSGGGALGALGLASQFGIDLGNSGGGGAFNGDNLLALMKSRSIVEKTLLATVTINNKRQTLAQYYIEFTGFYSDNPKLRDVSFLPDVERTKFTLKQNGALGALYSKIIKDNLTVDKFDKKLTIITVKVESENELFSQNFTEILVKNVSDFYIDTKTKKSAYNVAVLQRQTDSVRRELNAALTGVAATSDVNPNANPSLQILRVPSQRRQVDVQANQAILTQLVANLEISKVSLRKETPLIQVIDRPILPLEEEKFGKLKGLILGGVLFGFFAVLFFTVSKAWKKILR